MKSTEDLLKSIKDEPQLDVFLDGNEQEFIQISVAEYLNRLIAEKQLSKAEVIRKSSMDKTYAYQIFSGVRTPSRDKLIQLAIGMGLDAEEAQKMLKYCGAVPLYVKNRRDSIILHALAHHQNAIELDIQLDEKGEALLGE